MSPKAIRLATSIAAGLLIAAQPIAAFAWGERGHTAIDRAAVAALPDDGPVFLREYIDFIGASASIPDTWRSASEPFAKIDEDPNHGWFREQSPVMAHPPRSRYAFVLALYREHQRISRTSPDAAKRVNVRWTGTLPYAAMEGYGRLVSGMRLLRRRQAEGADVRPLQQTCAFYVAWLGHYIGDGAQPLHNSIASDGWRGPNPKGYTQDRSIHGRFETGYVDAMGLTEQDIVARMPGATRLDGDLFDQVLAFLNRNGDKMEMAYQLDKRGAFADPKDAEARQLVYDRTTAGATMLRDMVYRAWLESAKPATENTPNPLDFTSPAFDPETGSSPPAADR